MIFFLQGKDYEKIVRSKAKANASETDTWVDLGKRKRSSKFQLVDGELVHAVNEEVEDTSMKNAPKKKKLKNWTQDEVCDFCKKPMIITEKIACQVHSLSITPLHPVDPLFLASSVCFFTSPPNQTSLSTICCGLFC